MVKMRTKREPLTINNNVFRSLAIYRSEVVEDKVSVSGNSFPLNSKERSQVEKIKLMNIVLHMFQNKHKRLICKNSYRK